ncbi:MAG: hypothetical protein ABJA02_06485 [Acidobacteriota bacterium]
MNDRNWTPLTRTRPTYDKDQIRISMSASGMLFINQVAFHALRSPAAVAAYMDEAAGLIGIATVGPATLNALRVRKISKGNQRSISLMHFCTRFGLAKPKHGIHFPNPTFDPDGTLVLDYRAAVEASCAAAELRSCGVRE